MPDSLQNFTSMFSRYLQTDNKSEDITEFDPDVDIELQYDEQTVAK